jgi:predicted O-methyltransferase YrrM
MLSPPPIPVPPHVPALLSKLHRESLDQEARLNPTTGKFTSTDHPAADPSSSSASPRPDFDTLMRDKFIALDEDKCHFMYNLILATGATSVVEAGTSFGVSTIYAALAVARNVEQLGGKAGRVIGTEKEEEKADIARGYWRECGDAVESVIELRVGDLLQTLRTDLPVVDLLLLDSESNSSTLIPHQHLHFRPLFLFCHVLSRD